MFEYTYITRIPTLKHRYSIKRMTKTLRCIGEHIFHVVLLIFSSPSIMKRPRSIETLEIERLTYVLMKTSLDIHTLEQHQHRYPKKFKPLQNVSKRSQKTSLSIRSQQMSIYRVKVLHLISIRHDPLRVL